MPGVSFDEVWGDAILAEPDAPPPPAPPPAPPPPAAAAPLARRRGHNRAQLGTVVAAPPDADEAGDGALVDRLSTALADATSQLKHMRREMDRQHRVHTSAVYASIVIALILLVVTLQTCNKLQHTTECLLWHVRNAA